MALIVRPPTARRYPAPPPFPPRGPPKIPRCTVPALATTFTVDEHGRRVGPVAQHLLLENDDVKVWQVDTAPGETFWHHYHHFDYVLFHTSEMLGVVYNAEEDHERIWRARMERGDHGAAELLGAVCYEHELLFIPGTGFLSPGYVNIGETRFTAALIEV